MSEATYHVQKDRHVHHHHHYYYSEPNDEQNTWEGAPPWAKVIGAKLDRLYEQQQAIIKTLGRMANQGDAIFQQELKMGKILDRAGESLKKVSDAGVAVQAAIVGLTAEIRDLSDDPAVLAKLDELDAQSAAITANALSNTPAAAQAPAPDTPPPVLDPAGNVVPA